MSDKKEELKPIELTPEEAEALNGAAVVLGDLWNRFNDVNRGVAAIEEIELGYRQRLDLDSGGWQASPLWNLKGQGGKRSFVMASTFAEAMWRFCFGGDGGFPGGSEGEGDPGAAGRKCQILSSKCQ